MKPRTASGIRRGVAQGRTYRDNLDRHVGILYYDPYKDQMPSLQVVRTGVTRILAAQGFERIGATWSRGSGDYIDAIDLQRSSFRDEVTLNVGVIDKQIAGRLWGAGLEEPNPSMGTVQVRLGELVHGRDRWWDIDDDAAIGEMLSAVEREAIPFVDRMHSTEAMVEALGARARRSTPDNLYFALLKARSGDLSTACVELDTAIRRSVSAQWTTRFEGFRRELDCPEDVPLKSVR